METTQIKRLYQNTPENRTRLLSKGYLPCKTPMCAYLTSNKTGVCLLHRTIPCKRCQVPFIASKDHVMCCDCRGKKVKE